jgi:hypothetical protein
VHQCDHALDHLLPEQSVVPFMVDYMDLQLLVVDQKYKIHRFDQKSDRKKYNEVPQLVAVGMDVWTVSEVPVKDPLQT